MEAIGYNVKGIPTLVEHFDVNLLYIMLMCIEDGVNFRGRGMKHSIFYPYISNVYVCI
jgi:hypothetical protein